MKTNIRIRYFFWKEGPLFLALPKEYLLLLLPQDIV